MKKFVLLYIYIFLMLPVFAQTNFQELGLEKALEKAKGEGKMVFIDCIPHGVDHARLWLKRFYL